MNKQIVINILTGQKNGNKMLVIWGLPNKVDTLRINKIKIKYNIITHIIKIHK